MVHINHSNPLIFNLLIKVRESYHCVTNILSVTTEFFFIICQKSIDNHTEHVLYKEHSMFSKNIVISWKHYPSSFILKKKGKEPSYLECDIVTFMNQLPVNALIKDGIQSI